MNRAGDRWTMLRRQGMRFAGWLLVAIMVVLTITVVYFATPYEVPDDQIEAVDAEGAVTVESTDEGYVLRPSNRTPEAGIVFYPGARVHPNAYVPSLAPVVREANVTVVIPRMPMHLAIIDYGVARTGLRDDAATRVMNRHPTIDEWYVGGHSLGGAMACRYARNNPKAVSGLILYASYCDQSIRGTDLAVLSVAGSADTVVNRNTYERNLENLPADASVEELAGLNHSQFAGYRGQDEPSGTSYGVAHERLNAVTVPWVQNETAG